MSKHLSLMEAFSIIALLSAYTKLNTLKVREVHFIYVAVATHCIAVTTNRLKNIDTEYSTFKFYSNI